MSATLSYIIQGVCLTTIGCFGIVGNVLSAIVLFRTKSEKKSFRIILIGLSFYDTLYIIMSLILFGIPEIWIWYRVNIMMTLLPVSFGLAHVARVGSVYATVAVTLERYFAIVHPVKSFPCKNYFLAILSVFAVLYNVPKFFELRVSYEENQARIVETDLRKNEIYVQYYILWSKFIILEVTPYFIILFLNFKIVRSVRQSNAFRRNNIRTSRPVSTSEVKSSTENTNRLTFRASRRTGRVTSVKGGSKPLKICHVLLWISIVFIVCQSVKIIPDLYEVLQSHSDEMNYEQNSTIGAIICVSHLLLTINSSTNFIIYIWKGKNFKKELYSIFKTNGTQERTRRTRGEIININEQNRNAPEIFF